MSNSQPAAQDLERWPNSWHIPADKDSPKRLKCIACGCDHIFKTSVDIRYRWNHWMNNSHNTIQTTTDHAILRALNHQTHCPFCDYTINHKGLTIRDLFQHEWDTHGTTSTTNIEGIVTLVRTQLFHNVTDELQIMVFERMCQILRTIPEYRVMLQFCHLPPYTIEENFKTLLSPERLRPRPPFSGPEEPIPPYYTPFEAIEFLSHLAPDPFDVWAVHLNWEMHWNNLRMMYSYGWI